MADCVTPSGSSRCGRQVPWPTAKFVGRAVLAVAAVGPWSDACAARFTHPDWAGGEAGDPAGGDAGGGDTCPRATSPADRRRSDTCRCREATGGKPASLLS